MGKSLASAAVAILSSQAFASTWESDPAHTVSSFSAKHFMVTTVRGEFGKTVATLELDEKDITKSRVEATIDVTTINTRNEKRDAHLKSPDFFDAAKFPTLTFKSTRVEKVSDTRLKVTGDLTMRDVTKPVTLDVEVAPEVQEPWGKTTVRSFSATGSLNRMDWGVKWQTPMANNGVVVSEEVKLFIDAEFKKRAPAPDSKVAPEAPKKK